MKITTTLLAQINSVNLHNSCSAAINGGPAAPLMEPAAARILHLCSLGHIKQAISAFLSLPTAPPPPLSLYPPLLQACARHEFLSLGQSLHTHISSSLSSSVFLLNHVLNMYCKCRRIDLAQNLFDEMPERNLFSWTILLTGYSHQGLYQDSFSLFSSMLKFHLPNEFSLSRIISSCGVSTDGGFGRQAHALAYKTSLISHLSVSNSLISMYSAMKEEDRSWSIFISMPMKNLITWNSMISTFQGNGHFHEAFSLFILMFREGVPCDHCTLLSLSSSCSSLTQCRALQSLATKKGLLSLSKVNTAMVTAYSVNGGEEEEMYKLFDEAEAKDLISWTNIILAVSGEDDESRRNPNPNQATILFSTLRREGFSPDRYTFSAMAKALGSTSSTELHPLSLHGLATKLGFSGDVVFSNSLIHAYSRCGSIKLAENMFNEMIDKDLVSWNSMIKGYSLHGKGLEALRVFSEMAVPPDAATFVAILSACSHGGLVEEGKAIFNSMMCDYSVEPQLDHYACMVDLLGRAGHVIEAKAIIDRMPMDPDRVIWSGLLAACRKHGSMRIAEKAASRLVEAAPDRSAGYVLISNIYSQQKSFGEAAYFWKGMRDSGVKKVTGLSWIEIENKVHEFSVGGHRHPEIKAIKGELKLIIEKVKEIGYVPETSLVLHDIDEDQKEDQLYWHSEKLALAYGLTRISPFKDSIKIMKNIRICVDCHEFIRLVSKCVSKEVIVRDCNRFHHFKGGVCSCGDYW